MVVHCLGRAVSRCIFGCRPFDDLVVIIVGHRFPLGRVAARHHFCNENRMCWRIYTVYDLTKEPATNILFHNGQPFHQDLMADILELVRVPSGIKAQRSNHRTRGILGEHRNREDSFLFDTFIAIIVAVHAEGNLIRRIRHLKNCIDDTSRNLFVIFYTNRIHPVRQVEKCLVLHEKQTPPMGIHCPYSYLCYHEERTDTR